MRSLLDIPSRYPSVWLGAFAVGSLMCIAAISHAVSATAAGYTAGFLILAGTFGFEMLTRRQRETTLIHKIDTLENEQTRISRELARTRSDIDTMKDDMVAASRVLMKDAPKSGTARTVLRSFERISNRARTSFMPKDAPANEVIPDKELRAQKYKNLLLTPEIEKPVAAESATPEYSDEVITELIHQAIQNDKIEIFAQPIVKLPSRRLRYLELYARIRAKSGIYLAGQKYRHLAEKESLIENVDHLLLAHTLGMIRNDSRRNLDIGYFINVSSRSLKDSMFMNELLEFVRARRDLCSHLVLEFQAADFQNLAPALQRIVDGLTRIGCRISIDNVQEHNFDVDALAERGISFMKYNAQKMMEQSKSYEQEMAMMRLKSTMDKAGIAIIVDKIEDNHTAKELLDFEVDYGEGYLFGRPELEMAYRPKRVA